MLGKIKWYSSSKIYGFITGEDGRDYFFHHSDVAEFPKGTYPEFPSGNPVYFELVDRGRGWQAVNVEAIPPEEIFWGEEYPPAPPAREISEKTAIEKYPFLREIIPTPPEGSEGWWVPIPRKFEEWGWEDRYFYILPLKQDYVANPVEVEQKIHLVADDEITGCVYQSYENREDFQRGDTLLEELNNWKYPAGFDYIVVERHESRYDNNKNDWVETKIYSVIDLPRDFGARFLKEKSKVEKMALVKIKEE